MGTKLKRLTASFLLVLMLIPAMVAKASMPDINGSSAITFDVQTGEIIFSKNIDETMYPASITKLMTALLLSEHYSNKKFDYMKYPREARLEVPYSMYFNLKPIANNEEISADELMHALLLGSANDAATTIAINIGDTVEGFADLMNKKASELGMKSTHFVNATGLHDKDHYSTAYDIMLLLTAAYKDPWISEVATLDTYVLKTKTQTLGTVISKNKNIGLSGNVFGKTGYTEEAGRCLAAVYVIDGRTIGTVDLKSKNDAGNTLVFTDTNSLAEASAAEEKSVKIAQGQEVTRMTLEYRMLRWIGPVKTLEVPVVAKESLTYYANELNVKEALQDVALMDLDPFSVDAGTTVGTVSLIHRTGRQNVDLLSTMDVSSVILKDNLVIYIVLGLALLLISLFILLVVVGSIRRRKRAKQRRLEGRRSRAGRSSRSGRQ
jgi:D-alanyl-D-alanine carboxypeptidase